MSNPNPVNLNNLDSRYSKPADVAAAISAQAVTDAGQYATKSQLKQIVILASDYGVTGDMTAGGRTNMQLAVNAAVALCGTGKGVILRLPSGRINFDTGVTITGFSGWTNAGVSLPVNLIGHLTIEGVDKDATQIVLTDACRNAFYFAQQADFDVAQNYTFRNLSVDNNNTVGGCHILVGNMPGGRYNSQRLSFQNLTFQSLKCRNVPFDASQSTTYKTFIHLVGVQNPVSTSTTQTFSQNIYFEDIDMEDCQNGVLCYSSGYGGAQNHYYDNITMRRIRHKMNTIPTATLNQTSAFICGAAFGDRFLVEDVYSENIGDDSVEVGPMLMGTVQRIRSVNPFLVGILFTQDLTTVDSLSQDISVRDVSVEVTSAPFAISGISGFMARPISWLDIAKPSAWTASTAYAVGATAYNAGQSYTVTTAGTSAASGGPLGTTSSITDGSVVWSWSGATNTFGSFTLDRVKHIITGATASMLRGGVNGYRDFGFRIAESIRKVHMRDCTVHIKALTYDITSANADYSFLNPIMNTSPINTGYGDSEFICDRFSIIVDGWVTGSGASGPRLNGIIPQGIRGRVIVDGLHMSIINNPSLTAGRGILGEVGYLTGSLDYISLRNMSGSRINSNSIVCQGVAVRNYWNMTNCIIEQNDFSNWTTSGLADVDYSLSSTTNTAATVERNNIYANTSEIVSVSSAYTILAANKSILATGGTSGITVTLPVSAKTRRYDITKVDSASGAITVSPTSGTINGAASYPISTQWSAVTFASDGTNWFIV